MKRILPLLLLFLLTAPDAIRAQDANAAALLERREAEERYRILTARLQEIVDGQDVIMKRQQQIEQRLNELSDRIERVKEDASRSSSAFATREELSRLASDLKEVERKRVADNERVLKSIADLARMPAPAPAAADSRPAARERNISPDAPYYEHKVEKGQTLADIIAAYNAEFEKNGQERVSQTQVVEMNEGMKPNLIRVGQIIRIPVPKKK